MPLEGVAYPKVQHEIIGGELPFGKEELPARSPAIGGYVGVVKPEA